MREERGYGEEAVFEADGERTAFRGGPDGDFPDPGGEAFGPGDFIAGQENGPGIHGGEELRRGGRSGTVVGGLEKIRRVGGVRLIGAGDIGGLEKRRAPQGEKGNEGIVIGVAAGAGFLSFRPENGQRPGGQGKSIAPGKIRICVPEARSFSRSARISSSTCMFSAPEGRYRVRTGISSSRRD